MPTFAPRSVQAPLSRQVAKRRGIAALQRMAPILAPFAHVNGAIGTHSASVSSISLTLTGVVVGDLVLVGVAADTVPALTFTCADGSNTYVRDVVSAFANNIYVMLFRSVVTTGGTLTITVTPSAPCILSMAVDEYAFPAMTLVSLDGVTGSATGATTTQTTSNLSPTSTGLVYGVSTGQQNNIGTLTAGSGFTPRFNYSPSASGQVPILCEDIVANTTSPIAVVTTSSGTSHYAIVGAAYKAVQPPIYPSPSNLPANHANPITITLTGLGTAWTGSPFSVTGDAALLSQNVTSTTTATITVTTGSATGAATISDGTNTAALTVSTPTFSVAPPGVGANTTTTVTATGTNTLWASEPTSPPLFAASGLAGVSISNIVVTGNTSATYTLTSGPTTGSATSTDSSTTAAATQTVFTLAPTITVAPNFIPVSKTSITLTLTGTDTTWTGTPFMLSGVAGVILVSQTVTSNTAATIVVTTSTTTGTLTLTDGSYTATINVIPGAQISSAYIGRSGMAYFLTGTTTGTYAPPAVPTFSVTGTSVTGGGSGYTAPTAGVSGGIAVTLTNGGSGYTSAPLCQLVGANGAGARIIPTISGGCITGFTVMAGSGYTVAGTIAITGGGGRDGAATAAVISNGGTGCVLGTPVVAGGVITSIPVAQAGSGYTSAPPIAITDATGQRAVATSVLGGPASNITAVNAAPTIAVNSNMVALNGPIWTNSSHNTAFVAYQLLCGGVGSVVVQGGGSGYSAPSATATGGGGSGLSLGTPILVNGVITAISATFSASDAGTISISDLNGTGSGFVGSYTVATPGVSGQVTFLIENGGSGYSTNLHLIIAFNVVASTITVSNGVIGSVPVVSPGVGYTSQPTITITDGGSGSGAIAAALMTGPLPTDAVTYSAPAGWLTTSGGSIPAATNAAMFNFNGQLEPNVAQVPRTMRLGMNIMEPFGAKQKPVSQNWLHGTTANWTGAAQPISATPNVLLGTAAVTNGSANVTFSVSQSNSLHLQFCYFSGDTSGTLYQITSNVTGTAQTISPVFSGSNLAAAVCVVAPATSIIVYPAASDTTGMLAMGVAVVNSSGVITAVNVLSGGTGYTVAPLVQMPSPATGGSTATVTTTISGGLVTGFTVTSGGSGYGGSTADGHPIAVNSNTNALAVSTAGVPCAFVSFAAAQLGSANGTDTTGFPDMTGVWTFVADESSPNTPMVVSLYAFNANTPGSSSATFTATITHGPVIGGIEIGKMWQWTVTRTNGILQLNLNIQFAGPSSALTAPWTLSNEYLTAPARSNLAVNPAVLPNRAVPLAPDQNLTNWMTTSATTGAATYRAWPFGGSNWWNNVVDASDLRPSTDFVWNDGPQRSNYFTITTIRQYIISSAGGTAPAITGGATYNSPYVFAWNNYPGTASSAGIPGAPGPYYWVPPGNTSANYIDWIGYKIAQTQNFAGECVTAAPHGLKTGQYIIFPSNALTTALPCWDVNFNAGAGRAITINIANSLYNPIYVTGANTFAFSLGFVGSLSSVAGEAHVAYVNNLTSTGNAFNFPASVGFPPGAEAIPYAALAQAAAAVPGCGFHTQIPTGATDACVTAIAETVRDIMPVGRLIYPEFANEHWNNAISADIINCYALASLFSTASPSCGVRANNPGDFYTLRLKQIHDLFIAAFNAEDINGNTNRGSSIVCMFSGQATNPSLATSYMQFANISAALTPPVPVRIDAILVAPYLDVPNDSTFCAAVASAYSNYPGSSQYQTTTPLSMGQFVDLYRHFILFFAHTYTDGQLAAIAANYNQVSGQTVDPFLMCYECSTQTVVPHPVSTTDPFLRAFIGHDIYYHPYFADCQDALHVAVQQAGTALATTFTCTQSFNAGTGNGAGTVNGTTDAAGTVMWGCTQWWGQTWGRGDGSLDGNGSPTVNATFNATGKSQILANVAPKLQAWRNWATVANAQPAPPSSASARAKRWFPGLNRGRSG